MVKLRKKKSKTGRISLYLDIYVKGQRKYEFLNLYLEPSKSPVDKETNKETLKLAENICAKRQLEINTSQNGFNTNFKLKTNFFEFSQNFIETKQNSSTYRDYNSCLKHFKTFMKTDIISIGNIDNNIIENFKIYLNNAGLGKGTIFNYFARLKAIFHHAINQNLITNDPTKNVKNDKAPSKHKTFLTIEELQILYKTPCDHDELKNAFLFACNTGLRHVDIKDLKYENIINEVIQIEQSKTHEIIYIPLNENTKKLISLEGNKSGNIFNISKDVSYCNVLLKQWFKVAGINKNITFHVGRHTYATNLLIYGTDILTVSKMLGHTTLKHTQIYAKIVDSLKRKAVDSLPNFIE
jgi:site-specific recombinase XerD